MIKFRSIWCERKVNLDELDPFVKQILESRDQLPIYTGLKSPPTAIIREFYSNLFVHSAICGGHFLTTWIGGEEYQITKKVVPDVLFIPLFNRPTYPYFESPSLDDVMSLLCGKTMTWGTKPRLDSHELTKVNYLLFRITCHNIFLISHVHTIPIDRCIFLYAPITSASIYLPSLFIQTIVEVHKNTSKKQRLFFLVSILRILEYLEFECTFSFELVH